jgi:formate dehydrogenase subunit gamma
MAEHASRPDLLVRHDVRDRLLHGVVAIAFLFAATSGLALFHPALFWLSHTLGGGPWSVVLHPFVGLAMAAAFYPFARPLWRDNRLSPGDHAWLRGIRAVVDGHDERLPEVGKYNAGQKVLYFVMVASVVLLTLTGIVIWRRYFAGLFPVGVVRLGALLHAFVAFVLVIGAVVHVSAALWLKGSIAAITRGTVTLGWAYKHHRAWFREMIRPSGGR